MYGTGDWSFYHCQIGDVDSVVFVRTDLAKSAPDNARSWLLLCTLSVKSRRSDGFTDEAETERLWELEDRLERSIRDRWDGTYVGRYSGAGRRTLLFYLRGEPRREDAEKWIGSLVGDYEFELGGFEDRKWNNYLKRLYPNDIGWMEIGNQPVLDHLEQEGDPLEPERHTLHWLYFDSREHRDGFVGRLKSLRTRFDVVATIDPDEKAEQHGVRVEHQCSMLWGRLLHVQIELMRLAQEFNGEYDGFECELLGGK